MISTGREGLVKELYTGTTSEQNGVNICRLCGQCRCDVISIFSEEAHRKHVLLKIQTRLLIQISASDPLPKNACANCLEKLDSLWNFFELCRKTQNKLREIFIKQRRDERVTLWKDQDNIGTWHPTRCSLNSITHQTTQDTSDSASGSKRMKLELVPFMKEELVCLNENSRTVLAPTITSSAGSWESYRNDISEISAEPSKNSNVSVGFNHQQESDKTLKKRCLSEMVDAIIRRNMVVLQDCDIGDGRNSVFLNVKKRDNWKALFSDLKNSSLGQQEKHQNVLKTKPVILKRRCNVDKEAALDSVNSNAVQNCYREINAESSSDSHFRVRSGHQQESKTTVKKLCLDETVRRNVSLLQDCGSGGDGRNSASLSMKMNDHLKASSSDLIGDSLEQLGILQDVIDLVIDKQASFDHINSSAVQENQSSRIISVSHGESFENLLLDRTDSRLASTKTAEGRYSPVRSFVSDNEIHEVSLNGPQQVEERISMRKNQESFLTVDTDDRVLQQEINENSSGNNSLETINQARVLSINTEAHNFQLDKVENIMLRSSLCTRENLENDMRAPLQKEGTDTHVRKSVFQQGISTLEEKEKFSASINTVSNSDRVNNCGKLHDDGDEGDCDSSDCDNSFSCHDSGSSFSCKNSLTDHISKQHNHAGPTNTLQATPPTTVTLDCLDSTINSLSSFDVLSIHNTNTCDNVLQNTGKKSKSLLAQGKPTEDAQASHCSVPCVDGKDNVDTDNHVKMSVPQEGTKCSILEEKEKFSVSSNIVSDGDTVNNYGKDDYDDHSSFSCHDCGSSFSCKNSLTDHISKQHIHAGQTNILQVTPPNVTVTLDCLDSTINKLSSSDISVHNVNPCGNVLEKPDNNSRLLLAQGKLTEDAQASNCDVPSVDDNDNEDRDTRVRKSVSQEGIRCSVLEERGKFSSSDNIVSGIDTVNNCGKGGDDDDDHDDGDCVNSFSCHDCGSSFSCKNSLTDHIVKQHIHLEQTNTPHVTSLTAVTLDCLDSSINKLSSSDVTIHNTNTCDNSLQKPEKNNKSLLVQGKPTEDARASSCNVPSIDDNDCTVIYNSTSSNTAHVKPMETELRPDVKPLETELKPTTIHEARLMCVKYSERICETSGENPKIDMNYGSSFSCKNSLTDHISKQHIHAGQPNILQVTPPNVTVTLDCSDSTINKLSSNISVHNVNPCDNVLQKLDKKSRLLLAQGKPTEDPQASNCDVPSVDDSDKEDRDTHVRKSVSQEEIRCSVLEGRGKFSASNNIVSGIDTVNNCGKDDDDGDSSDCVNSFSCHDCGSSFSCKNSLTDHIVKQHIHLGQTNTPHATPLTAVTLDCLDSSINKLASSDVFSIHNTNTCDNSIQKLGKNNKSLLVQGKPTEDAQASSCNVPSIDDNDYTVIYKSTSSNTAQVKPIETELRPNVKPLETELKPTTIEEVRLTCEKYSKIICETSGENPKINMINVKVELTSGDTYTSNPINYRKIFKPFIVLNDSKYHCQICKTALDYRYAALQHIGKHFNLFPFFCKYCNRRFTTKSFANEHMKIHYEPNRLICEQCGSVFKTSSQFNQHKRNHDKPFTCHDCGKRFRTKDRVRSHILGEHMKIRSHACKICGKAYFYVANVATHMIFAHADRKIMCQFCGKRYFRNNTLKEHIRRWH